MNRIRLHKIRWNYCLLAFLLPFGAMLTLMIVSSYCPFGKYSMLYSDCYHQYYPFFLDFRRALRSGDSLLYNWHSGMGMDYLSLIAYYLGSPLNLVSVLLPESWTLPYFSLLVPIKLGFAGLFFSVFLYKLFDRYDLSITVFGGCYALCAWALGFQWNIMWVDTFALFPMVALGTVYLLRDKKFVLYTLSLFLAIVSNYYIGIFVCFFVALEFLCYEICRFAGWKRLMQDFFRIALFSAIAIGMTLFLTLPTVAALQTTQSSVNKFPTGFRLNIAKSNDLKGLFTAMRKVAGNMGGSLEPNFKEGLPNIYCGVGSVYFAVLFLMAKGVKLRDKLCSVGLLLFFNVSFIIRQLDYIWHGFHFTNMIPYRFSFLYCFVLLYMAYRGFLKRAQFPPVLLGAGALFTGALLACSDSLTSTVPVPMPWELGTWNIPLYAIYNFGFLGLYFIMLLYGCRKARVRDAEDAEERREAAYASCLFRRHSKLLFLLVAALELIATVTAFGLYFPGTYIGNYPRGGVDSASVFSYIRQREKWNLFYRTEVTHTQTLNDSALNNYNGITAFTSSANVHITYFLEALGYGAKNTYNRYAFEESSPVANLFLNLKYMVDRDGHDRSNAYFDSLFKVNQVTLLENNAYLPLGFLAQKELADVKFSRGSQPFQFQNDLFVQATGVDAEVFHQLGEYDLEITGNNVTVTPLSEGNAAYQDGEKIAEVIYRYEIPLSGVACVYLDLPKRNDFSVCINDVEQYRETISLPQMLSVGDVEPGDVVEIRITCKNGERGTTLVQLAILDDIIFRLGYERLAASTLNLTAFSNTLVEGDIVCDRDGLLYTSIPQNGNWFAYVDGEPQETTLIGDCMAGLMLSEGEHHVKFVYRNRAFALSWKLSAGCLVLFAALYCLWYQPQWFAAIRQRKNPRHIA